jgi:hypothetical protein
VPVQITRSTTTATMPSDHNPLEGSYRVLGKWIDDIIDYKTLRVTDMEGEIVRAEGKTLDGRELTLDALPAKGWACEKLAIINAHGERRLFQVTRWASTEGVWFPSESVQIVDAKVSDGWENFATTTLKATLIRLNDPQDAVLDMPALRAGDSLFDADTMTRKTIGESDRSDLPPDGWVRSILWIAAVAAFVLGIALTVFGRRSARNAS